MGEVSAAGMEDGCSPLAGLLCGFGKHFPYLLSVRSPKYLFGVLFSEPKQRATRKSILELSHQGQAFQAPWQRKPFLYGHKESSKHIGNFPQETQDPSPY